ncbi:AAA family ATPase [Rubrivivax sp. A210]|uniref:AAA family ATPase n=1 Tax=Rubrivivax sp. A210 TaxID=2772301 RepID=UPI0019182E71|nr:AAA family ATPase [Rubrivivax sp. A210]
MQLRFTLLGVPTWRCEGRHAFLDSQDAAWIARLALDVAKEQSALARLLWPHKDVEHAVGSLKHRFTSLRKTSGHPVCVGGDPVQLLPSVSVDVNDSLDELSLEELLGRGDLLAGLSYAALPDFQRWLDRQRQQWRHRLFGALNSHSARLQHEGRYAEARTPLERVLMLEPTLEPAWLRLMRLHFLQGNRTAAIDTFDRLQHQMAALGLQVHPEALELLRLVQRETVPALRPGSLPPVLERPPTLVGRERQLQAMERAWRQGLAFLLRGEPGIGKTRLIQDFAQSRSGILIVEARPGDEQSACSLLKRVLRTVLQEYAVTLGNELVRHQLSRLLDEFGPPPIGTTIREEALWEAGEYLLLAAVPTGLKALLIDNLHFADLSSVKALRWLSASKELGAVSFGFTAREEQSLELHALVDAWLTDPKRLIAVDLTPLNVDDLAQLIADLNLPERLPTSLASALRAHTGGIPYISIETLIDLWQQEAEPSQMRLSMPASIVSLLQMQLRAVPTDCAELVWAAALMGGDFTAARAAAVAGLASTALGEGLQALERCRVFAGPRFRHDLLRECALMDVPGALRPLLHVRIAEALKDDPGIPPGRLAHYWEAAKCWAPAARCLLAAAAAARMAGQLQAHQTLLERAAGCWQQAADADSAFDAWCRRTGGTLVLSGPKALLAELPQLRALAVRPGQQLRVMLLQADALVHLGDNDEALSVADAVLRHPALDVVSEVEAKVVRTTALAQSGRIAEALRAQEDAEELAVRGGDAEQVLRLTHLGVVVLFHNGCIGQAVAAARKSAELARAAGDLTEAVQVDGNLCTLLMVCGETGEAYSLARSVRRQHDTMGSSTNSHTRGLNLVALSNSAAWHGHFDEALAALAAAAVVLGEQAAPQPRAVMCMSSAYLWLTLGDSRKAAEVLPSAPDGLNPGLQMRWHWVQARVAALEGRPDDAALEAIGRIQAAHPDLSHGQSAWLEWSWQGQAQVVVVTLRELRRQAVRVGVLGFARATMVRELDRLADIDGSEALQAAVDLASELGDIGASSLSFQIYVPHAWLILARVWQRAGEPGRAAHARAQGRAWVLQAARRLPADLRRSFLRCNPVNRDLLDEADA